MLNGVRINSRFAGLHVRRERILLNVSTPHMTFRPFVTCSLTRTLFVALLVAVAPLPVLAASRKDVVVWLTTPDKTSLLAEQANRLHFAKASGGAKTITVDDGSRFQTM